MRLSAVIKNATTLIVSPVADESGRTIVPALLSTLNTLVAVTFALLLCATTISLSFPFWLAVIVTGKQIGRAHV